MKKSLIVILSFFLFNAVYGQYTGYSPDIVLKLNTGSQQTLATTATAYVSSVNLTGNFNELVIVVGFPDKLHSYPQISNDMDYPKLGVFPDGTLLSDYISSRGGTISADEWWRPALTDYFTNQSGGLYTVNFNFPKRSNGEPYLTTKTFNDYIASNLNKWDDVLKKWVSSDIDVVINKRTDIASDIVNNVYNADPSLFNNVKALHLVFTGIEQYQFYNGHGGFVYPDQTYNITSSVTGAVIFNGPIDFQKDVGAVAHERMHMIGAISGSPSGFNGFPDRGYDEYVRDNHYNLLWNYDMMFHNAQIVEQRSLYGLPPMTSHDLIFLGWIKPAEILTVNAATIRNVDFSTIKLSDINVPLTSTQISSGYRRIIKVMINENHTGDQDEYFLIEYHKATGFDKNFANYDEYAQSGYNKGILVWHIKEIQDQFGSFSDNLIDLETAVPYNGYFGDPLPDDSYPRGSYSRPGNWNGQRAGDFDYLDDALERDLGGNHWVYDYMPDGGRTLWDITTRGTTWGWYPPDPNWIPRLSSMKSDFFTDEAIKGVVTNRITDATRPSTKDWIGALKHIAITDMRRENDYMKLNVFYNYFAGTSTTLSGNVTFESNAYVPSGSTLTIAAGTTVNFKNGSSLIVNGTLKATAGNITFQRLEPMGRWGNIVFDGAGTANSELNDVTLNDGTEIRCLNGANIKILNSRINNFYHGIYIYKSAPLISGNQIINPQQNGIYGEASGLFPVITHNTITKTNHSGQGIHLMNSTTGYIAHNEISGCDYGVYIGSATAFFSDKALSMFYPNNKFTDNNTAMCAAWGGFISGGQLNYNTAYNTIHPSRSYDAYAYQSGILMAQYNYWEGYNPKVFYDGTSTVSVANMLADDPWTTPYGGPEYAIANNSATGKTTLSKTTLTATETDPVDLSAGVKLEKEGRLGDAISWYKTLVNSEKYQPFALSELMRIKNMYSKSDILSYMEGLSKVKKNSNLEKLLGDNYLQNGEFDRAVASFDNAVSSSASEQEAIDAKFSKLFAFINVKKDLVKAQEIFSDIKKGNVSDFYFSSRIQIAENLMSDPSLYSMENNKNIGKSVQSSENSSIVTEYSLSQNYPNPFNPSTVINYDIPKASKVSLKVYDMLGKEVATLVDEHKEKGRYSAQFNASNLPSGIYIYQLRTGEYTSMRKMMLVK